MKVCSNPNCNKLFKPAMRMRIRYCSTECRKEVINARRRKHLRTNPAARERKREADRKFYTDNKERLDEYGRQRRTDPQVRERMRRYDKRRKAIPEIAAKIKAYHRERYRQTRDMIAAIEKLGILTLEDFK